MTFAALSWAALAALAGGTSLGVLALYLLRRTPRPQLVSSLAFWQRAARSSRPRFLRATRVPWLAFLVSLAIALLLVAELGDPRFGRGVRGTTVIVLSAGRTMGAVHEGERRVDRALREVRRWVERGTVGGRVAVIRAGLRPETLLALSEDPADLDRALRGFELDDGPADLEGALQLADRILGAQGEAGQILLVADRDVDVATRATRVLIPVGVPADTLAIVEFSARRDPLAAGEFVAQVSVRSFSSRPASARVRVLDGAVPLLERRVTVTPGGGLLLTAQGFSAARAELRAVLEEVRIEGSEDALAADDQAFATVEPLSPLRVLLVTSGNDYLEAALAVHPNALVRQVTPAEFAAMRALETYDALVLDRTPLPDEQAHPSVVLFAPPSGAPAVAGSIARPRVSATLASHPVMRGVRLESVRIGRSASFVTEPGDQVLLRSGGEALALARERDARRLVAFGLELASTDLVERETFPILVHDALRWVAASRDELPLPRRLGEPLRVGPNETVLGPDGALVEASGLAAVRRQGIYHVGERAVAFSAAEHAEELGASAPTSRFQLATSLPPLAVLLALALLVLVLLEWALVHRGRLG